MSNKPPFPANAAAPPVGVAPVRMPEDLIGRRLQIASFVSLGINLVMMYGGAALAQNPPPPPSIKESRIEFVARETPERPAEVKTPQPKAPEPVKQPEPKKIAQETPRPEPKRERIRPRPQPVRPRPEPVRVAQNTPRPTPPREEQPVPPPEVKPPDTAPEEQPEVTQNPRSRTEQNTVARGPATPEQTLASNTPAPRQGTGAPDFTAPTRRTPDGAVGTGATSGPVGRRSVTVAQGERMGNVTAGGGEFTSPDSSIARATGAPALRAGTSDGAISPSTGGLQARANVSGSGGATVASPNFAAARGPVTGTPGAAAGPRNRLLTASERVSAESVGGFEIQQGGGIRAGTAIARQGSAGGSLGVETTAGVAPRFAGNGTGAGTGMAGIAAPSYSASRGPMTGGAGPIGPRGKSPVGYTGGDGYKVAGAPGGVPDGGSPGGILGGTGRPGQGATARNTGFGGGAGTDGIGTRVGARNGTPGAAAGAATSGTPGSGRGPIGDPNGAVNGPRGKQVAGIAGGGNRVGDPGSPGSPNGIEGGTGNRPGTGNAAKRATGGGGKDDITSRVAAKDGTPDGIEGAASGPDRKEGQAVRVETDAPKVEVTGARRIKVQDVRIKRRVDPDIPESLQGQQFSPTVRVTFRVRKDGSFTVTLNNSSGNAEVDRVIKAAMERWQFEPAIDDGQPIEGSIQATIKIKNK